LLRVVAFRKAVLAGAAGAVVWEAVLRCFALLGYPSFDIVRELGTLPFPRGGPALWWPAGMAAHMLVGAAWALFYAYFFWSRLRWPPALQGLAFAALPATLATLIVYPELQLMHLGQQVVTIDWKGFFGGIGQTKLGGLLLGHALFGLTVGALYTHPVGYRSDDWQNHRYARRRAVGDSGIERRPSDGSFIFATGIDFAYPTS